MKAYLHFITLITLVFVSLSLVAQDNTVAVNLPPAPEAAGLGQYGDIPVGEFSGSMSFNVPIHTLSYREVQIPISVDYHTNGVAVAEEASLVGLGWSLNAGGMITRSIQGYDDFGSKSLSISCNGVGADYNNYYDLANNNELPGRLTNTSIQSGYVGQSDCNDDMCPFDSGILSIDQFCENLSAANDLESDIYTFNLMGQSGKFFIGNDGEIRFFDQNDIRVEVNRESDLDVTWTFMLPNGVKAVFGGTYQSRQVTYTYSISRTTVAGSQTYSNCGGILPTTVVEPDKYISSWYLSEIILPGERCLGNDSGYCNRIDFSYSHQAEAVYPIPSYYSKKSHRGAILGAAGTIINTLTEQLSESFTSVRYDAVTLNQIRYEYGSVIFKHSDRRDDLQGARRLDSIFVNVYKSLAKVIELQYDYFTSTTGGGWDQSFPAPLNPNEPIINFLIDDVPSFVFNEQKINNRLRLNKVLFHGASKTPTDQTYEYSFEYKEGEFPGKTSFATDYWGFPNGQNSNSGFSPTVTGFQNVNDLDASIEGLDFYDFPGANREVNPNIDGHWSLEKVTYPTGGYTEVEYENNWYEYNDYDIMGVATHDFPFNAGDFCDTKDVESTPSAYFTIDNMHPDIPTIVTVDMSILLATCNDDSLCPDAGPICIGPDEDFLQVPFYFQLEDLNRNVIEEWSWNTLYEFGAVTTFSNGASEARLSITFPVLDENETYRLVMKGPPGQLLDGELPWNVAGLTFSLSHALYEFVPEKIAGGYRVKEIASYAAADNLAFRHTYSYNNESGTSSGKIYNNPNHLTSHIETITEVGEQVEGTIPISSITLLYYQTSSASVSPLSNTFYGNLVGYSKVAKTLEGNGSVENEYYNEPNPLTSLPENYLSELERYDVPRFVSTKSGNLLHSKTFDINEDLVVEQEYTYNTDWGGPSSSIPALEMQWYIRPYFPSSFYVNPGAYPDANNICTSVTTSLFSYANVPQWHYVSKMEETFYGDDDGIVEKTIDYEYENTHYKLRSEMISGGGESQITNYEYAFDLNAADYLYMAGEDIHMTGIPVRVEARNGVTYQSHYNTTYLVPESFEEHYGDGTSIVRTQINEFSADGYPEQEASYGLPLEAVYTWDKGLLATRAYDEFLQTYSYNDLRLLIEQIAVDDQITRYDYDLHQRLRLIQQRDEQIETEISYQIGGPNEVGKTTTFTGGDFPVQDKTSLSSFDGLGRLTHQYNNGRLEKHIIYDHVGRIEAQTYLIGNLVNFTYDNSPLNRVILETLPDNNTIQHAFLADTDGNLYKNKTLDEEGTPSYAYTDIFGRQAKLEDANGGITEWQYDDRNNIDKIITPMGFEYDYVHDFRNRMISKAVPGGGTATFKFYDDKDLLEWQIDGNGIKQSYHYDNYQRLTHTYLGELFSGDLLVQDDYYTFHSDGSKHVDKIKFSKYRVLDGGNSFTQETFLYDEYGRAYRTKFQHLLGEDISDNNFDMADRLRIENLVHQAHEGHTIVQEYDYDNFDRTTRIHHTFGNSFSAQIAAYSYNDRDQMTLKLLGSELSMGSISFGFFGMGYQYDNARGWLRQINQPFNDAEPIPICNDFQDPVPPPTTDPDDFYYQSMTLTEYLNQRFDVAFQFNPEEEYCYTVTCPPPTCATSEIQQEINTLETTIRREITRTEEVPCADGTTETRIIIEYFEHNFPTVLYRVRLCDNSERYVLETYLDLLPVGYEIIQTLPLAGPNQRFWVTSGGETIRLTLTEILALIIEGDDLMIGDFVPCGEEMCDYPTLDCPYDELLAQQALLDLIQANTPNVIPNETDYAVTVYQVQLCNGSIIYLLEEELDFLDGTTALVLGTLEFEVEDEEIPGNPNTPDEGELPSSYSGGVFHMKFDYTPSGNIDWYDLAVYNRAKTRQTFGYDALYRLQNSNYAEYTQDGDLTMDNNYGVPDIGYDADGNIMRLQRRGLVNYCEDGKPFYDKIDDLTYQYEGAPNRLTGLIETGDKTKGFKTESTTASYDYDDAGNMILDGHRGLTIDYNHLNLPKFIAGPEGNLTIVYDASGRKLRQIYEYPSGIESTLDYVSGIEYRNGTKEAVYHEEGRLYFPRSLTDDPAPPPYREYFIQDHLGNTRLVIGDKNRNNAFDLADDPDTDEIIQENNYYPFGMAMEGPWVGHSGKEVRYQYNGKELNEDIGLYEYGFRWYDPGIGRFTGVDPISDEFPHVSVYNYAENEPIAHIDLHGLQQATPNFINGTGFSSSPFPGQRKNNARTKPKADKSVDYSGIQILGGSGAGIKTPRAESSFSTIYLSEFITPAGGGASGAMQLEIPNRFSSWGGLYEHLTELINRAGDDQEKPSTETKAEAEVDTLVVHSSPGDEVKSDTVDATAIYTDGTKKDTSVIYETKTTKQANGVTKTTREMQHFDFIHLRFEKKDKG